MILSRIKVFSYLALVILANVLTILFKMKLVNTYLGWVWFAASHIRLLTMMEKKVFNKTLLEKVTRETKISFYRQGRPFVIITLLPKKKLIRSLRDFLQVTFQKISCSAGET